MIKLMIFMSCIMILTYLFLDMIERIYLLYLRSIKNEGNKE